MLFSAKIIALHTLEPLVSWGGVGGCEADGGSSNAEIRFKVNKTKSFSDLKFFSPSGYW